MVHPEYPLILAANRDEYYARPSSAAHSWEDPPGLLAGRDLQAGGTWLGLRRGRWAALTNFRADSDAPSAIYSRGGLVVDFLAGEFSLPDFTGHLDQIGDDYAGFNLLYGQGAEVCYFSNRGPRGPVEPGVHGLSNHLLDTPWPKVERGKEALRQHSEPDDLLNFLGRPEGQGELQDLVFIRAADYGTRCSTVLRLDREGRWLFVERRYQGDSWSDNQLL